MSPKIASSSPKLIQSDNTVDRSSRVSRHVRHHFPQHELTRLGRRPQTKTPLASRSSLSTVYYCSNCQTNHDSVDFSASQRLKPDDKRACVRFLPKLIFPCDQGIMFPRGRTTFQIIQKNAMFACAPVPVHLYKAWIQAKEDLIQADRDHTTFTSRLEKARLDLVEAERDSQLARTLTTPNLSPMKMQRSRHMLAAAQSLLSEAITKRERAYETQVELESCLLKTHRVDSNTRSKISDAKKFTNTVSHHLQYFCDGSVSAVTAVKLCFDSPRDSHRVSSETLKHWNLGFCRHRDLSHPEVSDYLQWPRGELPRSYIVKCPDCSTRIRLTITRLTQTRHRCPCQLTISTERSLGNCSARPQQDWRTLAGTLHGTEGSGWRLSPAERGSIDNRHFIDIMTEMVEDELFTMELDDKKVGMNRR